MIHNTVKINGIVYRISFPNGKCYIGITRQKINVRLSQHKRARDKGDEQLVYRAMRKYGMGGKVPYDIIDAADTCEKLCELEKHYIQQYESHKDNNGYNMTYGGEGIEGYKFNEEQRQNCRTAQKKRKEEHPEIAINHSRIMKQRHIDNPEIARQQSIYLTELYKNNPSKREDMSKLKIQQNKDNPDMGKQQSESVLMRYEDKDGPEIRNKISGKSLAQWKDPGKKRKLMDEKRKRFSKPFKAYKDDILIGCFDYVPDCALSLFNIKQDSGISAVLKGRKKSHKGFTFKYDE